MLHSERNTLRRGFLLSVLMTSLLAFFPAYGNQLRVCQYGCEFSTIQAAVAEAQPGDTVYIEADSYEENLTLDEGVHLVGDRGGKVILRPDREGRPLITVFPSEREVSIRGLTISGSAGGAHDREKGIFPDGIAVRGGAKIEVRDVILVGNEGCGIRAFEGSVVMIASSSISSNGRGCCFLDESRGSIDDSRISGNGIFLEGLANLTVTDSTLSNHNQVGLMLTGSSEVRISGSKIGTSETGIFLTEESSLRLIGSKVADAGDGIRVDDNGVVEVNESEFSDCTSGIDARDGGKVSVVRTRISQNDHGISLFDTAELSLRDPRIAYNDIGIRADTRSNVTVSGCGVKFFNNFQKDARGLDPPVLEQIQDRCRD